MQPAIKIKTSEVSLWNYDWKKLSLIPDPGLSHSSFGSVKTIENQTLKIMLENEAKTRDEFLRNVAMQMMSAARTAPKARGVDNLEIIMLTGREKTALADKLEELAPSRERSFYVRDSGSIRAAGAVVLIGSRIKVMGLDCGFCGFDNCADKQRFESVPCAFNATDLGIATGSATAKAADCRVDSRVMFSAGDAAMELGLFPGCTIVLAIPISATGKSPFFDRPAVHVPPTPE